MNWRKSVILKKAVRYGFDAIRFPFIKSLPSDAYLNRSPILANSFPKSGTHLLIQILQGIPGMRDWGRFLASTPSFTFREMSPGKMCSKINNMVPKELSGAHLFYSQLVEDRIKENNIVHYFIYRDPRDVVVSEAYYLSYMNYWHRLSRYFRSFQTMDEKIAFSITGASDSSFTYDYPNIRERFARYRPWLKSKNIYCMQFEELASEKRNDIVKKIIQFYYKKNNSDPKVDSIVKSAINNINPRKSHTFRAGAAGSWKRTFTSNHKEVFKDLAGDLLIELGYEDSLDW